MKIIGTAVMILAATALFTCGYMVGAKLHTTEVGRYRIVDYIKIDTATGDTWSVTRGAERRPWTPMHHMESKGE